MRGNAIIRIVLFSLAILVLIGLLIGGFAAGFVFNNLSEITNEVMEHVVSDEEIDFGDIEPVAAFDHTEIKNLEIEWAAGSIVILPSEHASKITVSETKVSNELYQMKYRKSGSTLEIRFSQKDVHLGLDFEHSKDLVIEVPMNWACDSLEIDTASAHVDIENLTISEFEFDGASGICKIKNCNIGELDLDTASGDVEFSGTLNILDCDAASASCRIAVTNVPQTIDIDTASGDLDLTLPENCGFSCSMETLSGRFSSDFETSFVNGMHVHNDGYCRIDVDAMSGDVTIRKHAAHSTDHHSE